MTVFTEPRRFLNRVVLLFFSLALLSGCGEGGGLGGGPDPLPDPDPAPEDQSVKLAISTTHATTSSMELYWVLFDARGDAVVDAQSKKPIRRILSVDLKGKSYELNVGQLAAGSTVVVLGFVPQTEGDLPQLNEAISKIVQPLVAAEQEAYLEGDYFYGKFTAPAEPTTTGELKMERVSGQMTLRLAGPEALVSSVARVELNFEGAPFYNGVTGAGVLQKVAAGSIAESMINFADNQSSYMLPLVASTGDSGKGRIYYGQGKVKEFTWGASAALRVAANQRTTITLTLSSSTVTPPVDPEDPEPEVPDPEQILISLAGSQSLVDGSSGSIYNAIQGRGYYTYKLIRRITKADFIPSVMALDGDRLYVGNNVSKVEGVAAPGNDPTYSVEVFDISTGQYVKTMPRDWTIIAKKEQFLGMPRAITISNGMLYAGYSSAPNTRVVVYNLATGQVETCIGKGVAAAAIKDDPLCIDEPMAIAADNDYIYLIDNYRAMRVYRKSDITRANYNNIFPYAKSAVGSVGKPHIMGMFRSPEGTLYRTDYKSQKLLAIDPSKITASNNLDIMNPARDIDLAQVIYSDPSIKGLLSPLQPYGVAYHHGNIFAAIASEDDAGKREGYLSEYSADGKRFIRSLRYMEGYTVKRPVAIIITGDLMIIADQLNKDIAVVQITFHPTVHYE